ncbi:unnamed protein product [Urochloa humidicola]
MRRRTGGALAELRPSPVARAVELQLDLYPLTGGASLRRQGTGTSYAPRLGAAGKLAAGKGGSPTPASFSAVATTRSEMMMLATQNEKRIV